MDKSQSTINHDRRFTRSKMDAWRFWNTSKKEQKMAQNENALNTIESGVKIIHNKILHECKNNKEIDLLYKGYQIYFSNIVTNPAIMFIGINPGDGYFRKNNKRVEKSEPLKFLEYLDESYPLANRIKNMFREINYDILLETAFKTNMNFFSTSTVSELESLLKLLPENLSIEIRNKSTVWIKNIVKEISPKIIICEGNTAFWNLSNFYNKDMVIIHGKAPYLEGAINNIKVLAFNRRGNQKTFLPILKERIIELNNNGDI